MKDGKDQLQTDRVMFRTSDPSEHWPLGLHSIFEERKTEVN